MSIHCKCGARMSCTDTRTNGDTVRRRYGCSCGARATTKETVVQFDEAPLASGNPSRPHARLDVVRKRTPSPNNSPVGGKDKA